MPRREGAGRPKRKMSAADRLFRMQVDPLTYIAHVLQGKEQPDEAKMQAARELLPYVYPKLKSVEVDVNMAHDIVIRIGASDAHLVPDGQLIDASARDIVHNVTATTTRERSLARRDDTM